jgi:hypothetical protein
MRKCAVLVFLLMLIPEGVAIAGPVEFEPGHYYEIIDASVTWAEANVAANALMYNGLQGHLVTITSSVEEGFLSNRTELGNGGSNGDSLYLHWIGGLLTGTGEWSWVTGETFSYTHWAKTEPSGGGENRIAFDQDAYYLGDGKQWDDLAGTAILNGYVVEYEGTAVPEPSLMLLLGFGLGAAAFAGWRKKQQ